MEYFIFRSEALRYSILEGSVISALLSFVLGKSETWNLTGVRNQSPVNWSVTLLCNNRDWTLESVLRTNQYKTRRIDRSRTDLPQTLDSMEGRRAATYDDNAVAVRLSSSGSQPRSTRQVSLLRVGGIGCDVYLTIGDLNLKRV